MYWWYRIVHVQQTLNYTNLTTAPKCKKPNLNLCMCTGVGVWVLLKPPFCVKHPIFTNISWDFDDLSTKTWHAPYMYNVWSSKHPPEGCTLDGNVIVTFCRPALHTPPPDQKRYPPFESGLPSPLGITEVPGDKCFFPSHVSQVFFPSMCWSSFFFFTFEWVKFFFYKNFLLPPPWSLMVRP